MMKRWKSVIGGCEQASSGSTSKSDALTLHLEKVLIKAQIRHLPHHCLLWGLKLKNTATNFISGFSLDSSQSAIYMHFNAASFHPALCNSLSITEGSINKQRQMRIWNQPLNCFFSPSLTGLLQLT